MMSGKQQRLIRSGWSALARSWVRCGVFCCLFLTALVFSGPINGVGRMAASEGKAPCEENSSSEEVVIVNDVHTAPRKQAFRLTVAAEQCRQRQVANASAFYHTAPSGHRLANGLTAPLRC